MARICTYHGANIAEEWMKKDNMGLVTDGTHVSNLKPKLGLRELTIGKDSNINP